MVYKKGWRKCFPFFYASKLIAKQIVKVLEKQNKVFTFGFINQ